jgi:hypothetical protein
MNNWSWSLLNFVSKSNTPACAGGTRTPRTSERRRGGARTNLANSQLPLSGELSDAVRGDGNGRIVLADRHPHCVSVHRRPRHKDHSSGHCDRRNAPAVETWLRSWSRRQTTMIRPTVERIDWPEMEHQFGAESYSNSVTSSTTPARFSRSPHSRVSNTVT